jgi:hypothetical protein
MRASNRMFSSWKALLSGTAALSVLIAFTIACWLIHVSPRVRALSRNEVAAVFGDACSACLKAGACTDPYTYGAGNCAYCQPMMGGGARSVCCPASDNLGEQTACNYGTTVACPMSTLMEGLQSGGTGSCGSCTSLNFKNNGGNCDTIKDATGDKCLGCTSP